MRERFAGRFGGACQVIARAPGRVNLIGDHTDYNDGFVLPIATQQALRIAGAARDDSILRVYSADRNEERTWPIGSWTSGDHPGWTAYVAGVAELLLGGATSAGGCDLLIESTIPTGGGLSSSAALEIGVGLAISEVNDIRLPPTDLIDLCRRVEHEFAGVHCGLMDQTASLLAEAGTALLLDCRSREIRHIPCELADHVFVVVDSGIRHELADGEYSRRQEECLRAVDYLQISLPEIHALRDVSTELLELHVMDMDPLPAARARHVVSENERTLAAADALERGEPRRFGRLMTESHRSLRDDYQVSCPELDMLARLMTDMDGMLGARMTGGGFGGCVVALAEQTAVPWVKERLATQYQTPAGEAPKVICASPSSGASIEYRA